MLQVNNIKDIQTALDYLGYKPGPIDGVYGRLTIAAVVAFQHAHKLDEDGIVGPITLAALNKAVDAKEKRTKADAPDVNLDPQPTLPWVAEAQRFMGLREASGAASNPVIMGFATEQGGWIDHYYTGDDIAWCGLFVCHCVTLTLPNEPVPANPLGALQWNNFGEQLVRPTRGCILTFTRPGGGHVGFYWAEDADTYHVLGGNQGDAVNIMRIAKSRLAACRWPKTVGRPTTGAYVVAADGTISVNEA